MSNLPINLKKTRLGAFYLTLCMCKLLSVRQRWRS